MKKATAALKTNYVIEVLENSNVQPFVCKCLLSVSKDTQ